MTGDSSGGWITVSNNVMVNPANTGMGVAGGSNISSTNNKVFAMGADKASLTGLVMLVESYNGYTPSNVTITGNHGIARQWAWGGSGGTSAGYANTSSPPATNVTLSNNNWVDSSITAAIWDDRPTCS